MKIRFTGIILLFCLSLAGCGGCPSNSGNTSYLAVDYGETAEETDRENKSVKFFE